MKAEEHNFKGLIINGFIGLFINLILIPLFIVLVLYFYGETNYICAPLTIVLFIAFILMLPGYISQEPNETRVMVFLENTKAHSRKQGFIG